MIGRLALLASVAALATVAAGCGSTSEQTLRASLQALRTPSATAPQTSQPTLQCSAAHRSDPTASLRPLQPLPSPIALPRDSYMSTIRRRGRLIAGVDQNTLLFSYLNPFTGRLQGFEIDLVHRLAQAILGDPNKVEFKAITTAQRFPFVQDGRVDLVVDAVTILCERWQAVSFSTVYYDAGQRLLVPKTSHVRDLRDLAGKRVCVDAGGTAQTYLTTYARKNPRHHPVAVPVSQRTDCLVALQQADVAAVASDDAILYGFAAQDPYTKIVGPRFTDEPYGIAIAKNHPGLVRFVNAVLAQMRADGTWKADYRKWLGRVAPTPAPPAAHYLGSR
jgi:polar amino acid transport system substrate-binding protein